MCRVSEGWREGAGAAGGDFGEDGGVGVCVLLIQRMIVCSFEGKVRN